MHLGLTIFSTGDAMRPDHLAREAEARGFESLWVPEHTHIPTSRETPYPGGGDLPPEYSRQHDPFVALSFAAAATSWARTSRIGVAAPQMARPKVACGDSRTSGGSPPPHSASMNRATASRSSTTQPPSPRN